MTLVSLMNTCQNLEFRPLYMAVFHGSTGICGVFFNRPLEIALDASQNESKLVAVALIT